jgi:PAS domain S-box-containing protein
MRYCRQQCGSVSQGFRFTAIGRGERMSSLATGGAVSVPAFDAEALAGSAALWDLLPVGILVCDCNGLIIRHNKAASALWGRAPQPGETMQQFGDSYHSLDGDGLASVAEVIQSGIPVANRVLFSAHPDGSPVSILLNLHPVKDAFGNCVGAVACIQDVSGLNRAQSMLAESERRSRAWLESLPVAIYATDSSGRVTFYNDAAIELWGRRPEIGRAMWCGSWQLYWADGKPMPHDQCPMAVALKEQRPIKGANAMLERPDGTRVRFRAFPVPLWDAAGNLLGALNTLIDITEFGEAEEFRQRLAAIVEFSQDAIVGKDLDGIITSWNSGAERLFGYTAEEVIGKPVTILIPCDHLDEEPEILSRIRRGDRVEHYETVRRRKDGSLVDVSLAVFPIRDTEGRVIGASKIAREITQRRQAEEIRHRLVSIVESSQDAIIGKDLDGIITSWNHGAEMLFGYTAEEAIGKPVTILIPADRIDEELGILRRIRRGERIEHYETVRRRKDGRLVDISLAVSPIQDAAGRVVGAAKIARDITERRRTEEQRQLLLREMNHRVKNLFSLAGGVVTLSARTAKTPTDLAAAVRERLAALARAHDLTLPDLNAGALKVEAATSLRGLIETIVSPFEGVEAHERRVTIEGPEVMIGVNAMTGVALLIHEFATNAAKYGAFALPGGQVRIDWSMVRGMLLLQWEEQGGPPLEQRSEEATGFGTLLAHRIVGGQFGGRIGYNWNRDGLAISLSLPLNSLSD